MGERFRPVVRIEVDAPVETAWAVLTGFEDYGDWNPFVIGVDGDGREVGGRIALRVVFPDGRKATPREVITRWETPADGAACLAYRYAGRGRHLSLVTAERTQRLTARPDGGCTYETVEDMGGWLRWGLPMASIRAGLEANAKALKARAEALHAAS